VSFFDLASLAKPLVTAPLALTRLDLDQDRRAQLGWEDRPEPLTVRQLLSHSAGLPAWLPYTGEPLAAQLRRGYPAQAHPKFRPGAPGRSVYSDLGYRLLADLLERETGRPFAALGAQDSGLAAAPWEETPAGVPDGPDADMWRLAEPRLALPARDPHVPQDLNARAGMRGHAGFGATPEMARSCAERWLARRLPQAMAVDTATGEDGSRWGLGLQRALDGPGRFGRLLASLPDAASGVHVLTWEAERLSPPAPALEGPAGEPTAFWFHLGFTGPALFVRPERNLLILLLAHRRGPGGELLDPEALRARRWEALRDFVASRRGR
jgi:CubicO group peptidase (beta-lactamase class C family)